MQSWRVLENVISATTLLVLHCCWCCWRWCRLFGFCCSGDSTNPPKCRQQRQQYRQNRGFVYFALQRYEASSKRVARRVSSRFRRQDHKQNFIMKLERQPARLHATTWSPVTAVVVSAALPLSRRATKRGCFLTHRTSASQDASSRVVFLANLCGWQTLWGKLHIVFCVGHWLYAVAVLAGWKCCIFRLFLAFLLLLSL